MNRHTHIYIFPKIRKLFSFFLSLILLCSILIPPVSASVAVTTESYLTKFAGFSDYTAPINGVNSAKVLVIDELNNTDYNITGCNANSAGDMVWSKPKVLSTNGLLSGRNISFTHYRVQIYKEAGMLNSVADYITTEDKVYLSQLTVHANLTIRIIPIYTITAGSKLYDASFLSPTYVRRCTAVRTNDPLPASSSITNTIRTGGAVDVQWSSISGATSYDIEIRNSSTNAVLQTKTSTTTTTSFSGLANGTRYYTVVYGIRQGERGTFKGSTGFVYEIPSAPSTPDSSLPAPTTLTPTFKSGGGMDVTWSSVSGATSYDIELKNATTNAVIQTNNATSISTSFSGLTQGTSYYLVVYAKQNTTRGAHKASSTFTYQPPSNNSSTTTPPAKPVIPGGVKIIGEHVVKDAAYNDAYIMYGGHESVTKVNVYTKVGGTTYTYDSNTFRNYSPVEFSVRTEGNAFKTIKGVYLGSLLPKTYTFGISQTVNGVESDIGWAEPYTIIAPNPGQDTNKITQSQLLLKPAVQSASVDRPSSTLKFTWKVGDLPAAKVAYYLITTNPQDEGTSSGGAIGIVQPNPSVEIFMPPKGNLLENGKSDRPYKYYVRAVYDDLYLARDDGTLLETTSRKHFSPAVAFEEIHYPMLPMEQLPDDQLPAQAGCRFFASIEGSSPQDPTSISISQKQDVILKVSRPSAPAQTTADDIRYRLMPKYIMDGETAFSDPVCQFGNLVDVPTGRPDQTLKDVHESVLITQEERSATQPNNPDKALYTAAQLDAMFQSRWDALSPEVQSEHLRAIRVYIDPAIYGHNGVPAYRDRAGAAPTPAKLQQFILDNAKGYLPLRAPNADTCKITIPGSKLKDGLNNIAVQSLLYDAYSDLNSYFNIDYPRTPYKCLETPYTLNINVVPQPAPEIGSLSIIPENSLIDEPTLRESAFFPSGKVSLSFVVGDNSNTPLTCKIVDSKTGTIHNISNCAVGVNNTTLNLAGDGARTLTLSVTNGIGKEDTEVHNVTVLSQSPSVQFSNIPTEELETPSTTIGLSCTESSVACKKLEYIISDVNIPAESLDMFLGTAKECANNTCSITIDSTTSYTKYVVARMTTASGRTFYSTAQQIRFDSPHNSGDLPEDPGGPTGLPDGVGGPSNTNSNSVSNTNQNNTTVNNNANAATGNSNQNNVVVSNQNTNTTNANTNAPSSNQNSITTNNNTNIPSGHQDNSNAIANINQNSSTGNVNTNTANTNQNTVSNNNTNVIVEHPAGNSTIYVSTGSSSITPNTTTQPTLEVSTSSSGSVVTVQYNGVQQIQTTVPANVVRQPVSLQNWTLNTGTLNTLRVTVRDLSDNIERSYEKTVFQDSKAPTVTILSSTIDAQSGIPVWSFQVEDSLAVQPVKVVATNITTGTSTETVLTPNSSGQYTYTYQGKIYPGHQYRIELYASDIAGNGGNSVSAISSGVKVPIAYSDSNNPKYTLIPLSFPEVTGNKVDVIFRQGSFSYISRDIAQSTYAVLADLLEKGQDSSGRVLQQIPAGVYSVEIRSRTDNSTKVTSLIISPNYFASNGDINNDGVLGLSDYILSLYGQNKGMYRPNEDSTFLSEFIGKIQNAFAERKLSFYRS